MRVTTCVLCLGLALACGEGQASEEVGKAAYRLARDGMAEELRALLAEHPQLANALDRTGMPLLENVIDIRPAFPNMHQTIEVLLQSGADPNLQAPDNLRKAIWRGDPESFELLLKYGADPLVVWEKKQINMLEYARNSGDDRFLPIIESWEAGRLRPD